MTKFVPAREVLTLMADRIICGPADEGGQGGRRTLLLALEVDPSDEEDGVSIAMEITPPACNRPHRPHPEGPKGALLMKASNLDQAAKLHRSILSIRALRRKIMTEPNCGVYIGGLNQEHSTSLPALLSSHLLDEAEKGLVAELRSYGVTVDWVCE